MAVNLSKNDKFRRALRCVGINATNYNLTDAIFLDQSIIDGEAVIAMVDKNNIIQIIVCNKFGAYCLEHGELLYADYAKQLELKTSGQGYSNFDEEEEIIDDDPKYDGLLETYSVRSKVIKKVNKS